jgi:uncharacterized protein (TIGR02145 family)
MVIHVLSKDVNKNQIKVIMKKSNYLIMCTFAMLLASCSTEESADSDLSKSQIQKVSLSAAISTPANTRVTETADNTTGLVTSWESGKDKINVLLSTGKVVSMTNVDGGNTFDGTALTTDVDAFSNTAYIVNDKDDDSISTNYNSKGYMEVMVDYAGQNGSLDNIAHYDLMYGTGIPKETVQLNHKICVLRFDLNSTELSSDAITKITGATLTYTPNDGNKQIFASSATYYLGSGASSLKKDTSLTVINSIEMTGMNVSVSNGAASIYVAVPECSTATAGTLQLSLTGTDGTTTHCYYLTNNITVKEMIFGAATVQGKTITALTENETVAYGDFLYKDGSWGAIDATYNTGKTPVALVFAKKDGMSSNDTEKGWTHGYAMALKNANTSSTAWCSSSYKSTQMQTSLTTYDNMKSNFDGFTETNVIKNSDTYKNSTAATDFPACYYALNYEHSVSAPLSTSGWYLPSSGQWYEILTNIGGASSTPDGNTSTGNINIYWNSGNRATCISTLNSKMSMLSDHLYDKFPTGGVVNLYWCSSEFNQTNAFYVHFDSNNLYLAEYTKTLTSSTRYIRPVIAF